MGTLNRLGLVAVAVLAGCRSEPMPPANGDTNLETAPAASPEKDPGSLGTASSPPPADAADDGCSEAAKLVYVVGYYDHALYSFKPSALEFKRVGVLDCTSDPQSLPRSMAVDRSGMAFLNYNDGHVYKANTKDASCTDTNFRPPSPEWTHFGLGFVSDGRRDETLYAASDTRDTPVWHGGKRPGLAKLDLGTFTLTPIGSYPPSIATEAGELTGAGNGHLFGLFNTPAEMTLSELDPTTSAAIGSPIPLHDTTNHSSFAFSFWGGDFWIFVSDGDTNSKVIRYRASGDKSQAVVVDDVGFQITGAGVSTCAPTMPTVVR